MFDLPISASLMRTSKPPLLNNVPQKKPKMRLLEAPGVVLKSDETPNCIARNIISSLTASDGDFDSNFGVLIRSYD